MTEKKIAVIDDDVFYYRFVKQELEQNLSCIVDHYRDINKFKEVAEEYSAALLDLNFEFANGSYIYSPEKIIEEVKSVAPGCSMLVVSGSYDNLDKINSESQGRVKRHSKDLKKFEAVIEDLIDSGIHYKAKGIT